MEAVQLRMKLFEALKSEDWKFVIASERRIYAFIRQDGEFFDANFLKCLIELILPFDPFKALTIGHRIIELFEYKGLLVECQEILYRLFFPTIFDKESSFLIASKKSSSNEKSEKSLNEALRVETRSLTHSPINQKSSPFSDNQLSSPLHSALDSMYKKMITSPSPNRSPNSPKVRDEIPIRFRTKTELERSLSKRKALHQSSAPKQVLDSHAWSTLKTTFSSAKIVLPMLELEMYPFIPNFSEFYKKLYKTIDTNWEEFHGILKDSHTVSAVSNRIYLNILLQNNLFEDYFIKAYKLLKVSLISSS